MSFEYSQNRKGTEFLTGMLYLNQKLHSARANILGPRPPLRTSPESLVEVEAKTRLRDTVRALPSLPKGRTRSEEKWLDNRRVLRTDILGRDPRYFLRWPVVQRGMVVRSHAKFVRTRELPVVRSHGWMDHLNEQSVGCPQLIRGTLTSGNAVHHAYHLVRFENLTGQDVKSFDEVIEIGAGYGSMCRIIHRLSSGRTKVTLFDLPEFSALQEYFLGLCGVPATLITEASHVKNVGVPRKRLLLATWSLSEIPRGNRLEILESLGEFDAYLIAFQEHFAEIDNLEYFNIFSRERPHITWFTERIDHLPRTQSRYLFGVK